jgi:hypothetical protein
MLLWASNGFATLFFSPEEKEHLQRTSKENQSEIPKLNAIFYLPELQKWIVWINQQRIDSQRPRSIDGWRILRVTAESVTIRSMHGQELELFLEEHSNEDLAPEDLPIPDSMPDATPVLEQDKATITIQPPKKLPKEPSEIKALEEDEAFTVPGALEQKSEK